MGLERLAEMLSHKINIVYLKKEKTENSETTGVCVCVAGVSSELN